MKFLLPVKVRVEDDTYEISKMLAYAEKGVERTFQGVSLSADKDWRIPWVAADFLYDLGRVT